jgi:folate-dependent phosphoribosylglycinamide formyltransferase PurN
MMSNKTLIVADSALWLGIAKNHLDQYGFAIGRQVDLGVSGKFLHEKSPERSAVERWHRQEFAGRSPTGYHVDGEMLSGSYTAILSLHCKQLFSAGLCEQTRCYNIHPGYLPYGRGWAPITFARLTGGPVGATLHKVDPLVDHGQIIERREVPYGPQDTCETLWPKVKDAERDLFHCYFVDIHTGEIEQQLLNETHLPGEKQGPVRSKAEYEALLKLDLSERMTMGQAIHRLAACSIGLDGAKLYYEDNAGFRVYVNLQMERKKQ